ncbi:uncharacterized protein MELLADRAFT_118176 [Melampsora larici-populina 98AG31]|uniref:Uncharacterized protein n=1 Tax=Melampsora larici-populina (strain 98AG31 / pathotype 3-4-7) TaxID=747676 RepID=F4S5W0_MELLP|nr:uncharacterized protein MELLADRAFT_118176 [Melampsora larici-populina 98AG31]EGF99968.1 hypothetical protein MELLADRAFT_118176 [Melampsora larici-populina 98AG31]
MNPSNSKQTQHPIKFPLSKIHRLLRPLKSSIISLKQELIHQHQQQASQPNHHHIYHESKSIKRKTIEQSDYHPNPKQQSLIIKKNIKRLSSKSTTTTTITPFKSHPSLISSPLFESTNTINKIPKKPYYGPKRCIKRLPFTRGKSSSFTTNSNSIKTSNQIEQKLSKVLAAYKNVLDSVTLTDLLVISNERIPLTVICAQVIGFQLESLLVNQFGLDEDGYDDDDDHQEESNQISLIEEEDWKTSLMDEWYDAIPINYRKYALAQHSLSLILNELTHERSSSCNLSYDLLYKLHELHRTYASSDLICSQASKLLNALFELPQIDWYELYDASFHQFGLKHEFLNQFHQRTKETSFLKDWSNWKFGLIGFIDKSIHDFGLIGFQKWVKERSRVLKENLIKQEEVSVGLRSDLNDSDFDHQYNCELIEEFDEKTGMVLGKWIDGLVKNSLPNSIHSRVSRDQLDGISDLVFDEIRFDGSYSTSQSASTSRDPLNSTNLNPSNQLLIFISLLIESHRFTLSNLSIFKLPYTTINTSSSTSTPLKLTKQEPTKLIKLLNFINHDHHLLSKVSKHFLRSHQSTELFSILSPNETMIRGLNELFELMINGSDDRKSLIGLGKLWIECLLKTDPIGWWNGKEDQVRFVRDWLDDWYTRFDEIDRMDEQDEDQDQREKQVDWTLETLSLGGKKFRKIRGLSKPAEDRIRLVSLRGRRDVREDEDGDEDEMRIGSKGSRGVLKAVQDDQVQEIDLVDVKSDVDEGFGDHEDLQTGLLDVGSDEGEGEEMMMDSKSSGVKFESIPDRNSVEIKSDEEEDDDVELDEDEDEDEEYEEDRGLVDVKIDEEEEKIESSSFGGSLRSSQRNEGRRKIGFAIKSDDDEMIIHSKSSRKGTLKSGKDHQRHQNSSFGNTSDDEDDEMIIKSKSSRVSSGLRKDHQSYRSSSMNMKSDEENEEEEEEMEKDSKLFRTPLRSIQETRISSSSKTKLSSSASSSSEDEISFIKERYQTGSSKPPENKKLRISNRIERIPKMRKVESLIKGKGKIRLIKDEEVEEVDELDFLSDRNRSCTPWCRKSSRIGTLYGRKGNGNGTGRGRGKAKGKAKA